MASETPFYTKTSTGRYLQVVTLADREGEILNLSNNALDVSVQDQHTDVIIVPFNQVQESTTLDTLAVLGEYTISLTDTTGFIDGSFVILFNPDSERFSTFYQIGAPSGQVITLDSPLDFAYPSGTNADAAITDLVVDGSVTPQVFGLRGTGAPPGIDIDFDLTRIIFELTASSAIDLAKFGNLDELTRGILFRSRDGIYHNIFNVKTNGGIAGIMYDWTPFASTNPVQGIDGFTARLTFAGQSKIGVTIRLPIGEDAEIIIQDDLVTEQSGSRTLTSFKIMAEGHIVE